MTGPAGATGFREITDINRRITDLRTELRGVIDNALIQMGRAIDRRLDRATAELSGIPDRVKRLEDLLKPLTIDPADPGVEWYYRRPDGILRPAPTDPDERAGMIANGIRLFPAGIIAPREDGRMTVLPPPKMVDQ